MADKAHRETDLKLEQMERHLSAIYSRKEREIRRKAEKFAEGLQERAEELLKACREAETLEEKRKAKAAYIAFFKKTTRSPDFKRFSSDIAQELYNTNQEANAFINGKMTGIYALNFNAMGQSLKNNLQGYEFTDATEKEIEKYAELELQTVDQKKDTAWNEKNIKAAVTTGAFLLLPCMKIFLTAIKKTVKKNKDLANLHSRDMATGAENKGRLDTMYRASDFGFDLKKRWNATKDNRTRDSHAHLDGKVLPLDGEFLPGLSQPRDPHGAPAEIYNCRCWLSYVVDGAKRTGTMAARKGTVTGSYKKPSSFKGTETVHVPNMTYTEWAKWRKSHGRGI